MRLILLAAASVFVLSVEASAQTVVQGKDKVRYPGRTFVDCTPVDVVGEVTKPEGQYGFGHPKFHFNSLIKFRVTWNPELDKTVERL